MKCPLSGLVCERAEVKLVDGPVIAYRCVEHGGLRYVLLAPDAMARFDEDWQRAREIIAAQRGDSELGGDAR